ncbi:MAG: glycosyltransferase [Bacteroidia bacterium]
MKAEKGKIENEIKFIYWFAYYDLFSPSVRYRAKYPLDFLQEAHCIKSFLVMPGYSPERIWKFLIAYVSALFFRKKDSLIVIQRVQSSFIYATFLKLLVCARKTNTIYDIDDADYLEVDPAGIYFFAKHCSGISAGSKAIADHLTPFNKNIIHVTSPVVDLSILKEKRNEHFTIGWIGEFGGDHQQSLFNLVFPAVKALLFRSRFIIIGIRKAADRKFIADYFADTNVTVEMPGFIDWNNEEDLQNCIVQFDVGIATLLDNIIQLSKSGIKAKQYLTNGVPVLSSDLPENNNYVIHGENGFLCSSPEDFAARITELRNMSDERYSRLSKTARACVTNFDHPHFLRCLSQFMKS